MISSKADFFFFSPLDSELLDVSFLLVDAAAALGAIAPRAELQGDRNRYNTDVIIYLYLLAVSDIERLLRSTCTWI